MNEIPWQPWSDAAFERARSENRPVLLHIGATWCHWCHVMDVGTYPHPEVIRLARDRFVCIRVDTDHRPDINERYNQGGWPTCCILDADGEVLVGRLYMPAQELIPLLESTSTPGQRWVIGKAEPEAMPTAPVEVDAVWAQVKKGFDPWHGGFGELEKFPHPGTCEWILDRRQRGLDDAGMLDKTLDAMAAPGLYDPVDGAFFRYATRDDWQVPHYEKLLDDNARLLRLYARAGVHDEVVAGTVTWLLRHLWTSQGLAGSMDASEEFYCRDDHAPGPGGWGRAEGHPSVDRAVYAGWNGLAITALLRASARLGRPGLAGVARMAMAEVATLVDGEGVVSRLAGGARGLLDDQALVAEAAVACGAWTGDDAWLGLADRCLRWTEANLRLPSGYRDVVEGGVGAMRQARRPLLANAALGEAAWRLFALSGDEGHRAIAEHARDGALAEAVRYGFMAAPAAALAERMARRPVVAKCNGATMRDALWNAPDPDLVVRLVHEGTPPGTALACSPSACARPSTSVAEVLRHAASLR
ncbi:MAG: thioredoxin domain-containing protein [Deltaproteobacteria bacterium]|nr:thioredoxin domain-containing protein [Deltaproteobacteria bacterium]